LFALALRAPFWIAVVPCVLLQHRIGILIHEYIHGIPFRRRSHNLAVVAIYDGLMICVGLLELFRNSHLTHHRWVNSEGDPAWVSENAGASEARRDPARPETFASRVFAALNALELPQHAGYLVAALAGRVVHVSRARILRGFALSLGSIAFWAAIGRWWMAPMLIGLSCFCALVPSSLRGAVEHHSFPGDPRFANEYRAFIPLFNLNRHVHHHLDPKCPWYRLRFVTADPLPSWCFVTYWFEVYVRRRYTMMAPMERDWRAQINAGTTLAAARAVSTLPPAPMEV
jgi:fatty acid desaturase